MKKFIGLALAAAALAVVMPNSAVFATHGGTGNGAPNGAHFNLNIIGVPKVKTADMTGSNGHRIFVKLSGKTRIMLAEGDSFKVLDGNGTDGKASFQLPNPDPDGDGTTVYSVFARALGKPGSSSITTTCTIDPGDDGELGTADDVELCSGISMELERSKGKSKFENVSKYLLYVYADIDGDGTLERMALFDDRLENYFWEYNNSGLKLVQLRFYECSTDVGLNESDCFGGSHKN